MSPTTPKALVADPQREALRPLTSKVWIWSTFSLEKQLYFNGFLLHTPQGCLIVDPPSAPETVFEQLNQLTPVLGILLTNKDHERHSQTFQERLNVPIYAPVLDAGLLERPPEMTYESGEVLWGLFQVIGLSHQKSPGESALYWAEQNTLLLGDALIGKPAGSVSMLPGDKYADSMQAFTSLKQELADFSSVETLLLADGESILKNAGQILTSFFQTPH